MNPGKGKNKRILEWVAISCSRESPDLGIQPTTLVSPALAGSLYHWATWEVPCHRVHRGIIICSEIIISGEFDVCAII